ncbi:Ig-like domain-containing protein [Leucobacter chromiireducens]|uniref:Ig-like domain-containing protein n=1 Tax=Leucobacter chromiireducens TaxID=283877 RepID=UPI000F638DD3|nr:Ig-like domain-containing protein [Leucobacter chromiireducens]
MSRRRLWAWGATGVATALVATIAIVSGGYDARDTPRVEPGVWVARDAGQYGRVNTDTGELDTVRKVAEPSGVVQAGGSAAVLTNGAGEAWPIAAGSPQDLGARDQADDSDNADGSDEADDAEVTRSGSGPAADAARSVRLPEGAREVLVAGRFVVVRTEAGGVLTGELGGAGLGDVQDQADVERQLSGLRPIDEDADAAAAIALTERGTLAVYSSAEHTVRRFDAARGTERGGPAELPGAPLAEPQLALVGEDWVLLDAADGRLLRAGADPDQLVTEGSPRLQLSSSGRGADGTAALIADQAGLLAVAPGADPERIAEASGAPARPTEVAGERFAAWLGSGAGSLWRSGSAEPLPLQFDDAVRDASDLAPVIQSNGDRAVLSEPRTGMLWTLPDGALIPLSQWSLADPPQELRGAVVVEEVTEQVAPTAVDDAFGARPGMPTPLPVLLNDFDANVRDVLTIVPDSISDASLPKEFGSLELLADRQSLVFQAAPGATGTASFSYRISDGSLESAPATVTLRIAAGDENAAPAWCAVEGCQREWGVPAVAPGGTLVAPLLEGWVDPEGDVLTLAKVTPVRAADPVRALVTADGRLAVRHTDPNAGPADIGLRVTVRDSRGAEAERELTLQVRADAVPVVTGTAATIAAGQPTTVRPLERVAGGSGAVTLVDVVSLAGTAQAAPQQTAGTVQVTASDPGVSSYAVTVRDAVTGAEATGTLRVTAVAGGPELVLPPLRAYVRPLADSTVEVLDAIPGAQDRALAVRSVAVVDGDLSADVVEHARVRVAGNTADGAPGRIGSADVTVAEGDASASGRLTVFQVPETSGAGVIAVGNSATVRAGSTVDVRVLENDVAPPGERLLLDPKVTSSGAEGELAFAAGGTLRYVAPDAPGTYRVSYSAYAAGAPELSDSGEVVFTVVGGGANRDPQPGAVTARVAPGGTTSVRVPVTGVDPDGDRVRLTGIDAGDDPRIAAALDSAGAGIEVTASAAADAGTQTLSYEVSDGRGGTGRGTLHVVVTGDDGGAPTAMTDQVRLVPGGETVIRPLDNDVDPAGGTLTLGSVVPNTTAAEDSAEYRALADAIDLSALAEGRVGVRAGAEVGTVSYRYTVRSEQSGSTADGLIVVQTSERVGAQAPAVRDTVLSVRDRSQLAGRGVDVLTGKVRWQGGDPDQLTLSLWDAQRGEYRAAGSRISGDYDPAGDLVVFKVSGTDANGTAVASYGFLVIPPLDELRLTLQPGLAPLEVGEGETVTARVSELVDAGPADRVELRSGVFASGRPGARCEADGASAIRYAAGRGAPWTDSCQIEVRLAGQERWTVLPVPVRVVPDEPIAELRQLTRTIAPGATETIALTDMVTWQGERAGSASALRFTVSGGGDAFEVTTDGGTVRATARADARAGVQESLTVAVSGAGESRAALTLRVGESPRDLPRGGTVALNCTVGEACAADLVGVAGEHDPFAGKRGGGLRVTSVDGAGCAIARFAVSGERRVSVSWPDASGPGGTCTVGYSVRDAQGRAGSGSIELDAQGLPDAPASITQTGFTASSATFRVVLGGRQAHPEVTGVRVQGAGSSSCSPAGAGAFDCVVSGLESGARSSFTARAQNAVGESAPSSAITAWAYRAPEQPTVTVSSLQDAGNTDQARGGLRVSAVGSADTRELRVAVGGVAQDTISGSRGSVELRGLPVGAATVTVTPVTAHELPPVPGGSDTGTAAQADGRVIGAPILRGATLQSAVGSTSVTVVADGGTAHGSETVTLRYAVAQRGVTPDCVAGGSAAATFGDRTRGEWVRGAACASSAYGVSSAVSGEVQVGGAIPDPRASYAVSTTPTGDGSRASYGYAGAPTAEQQLPGATLVFSPGGGALPPDNPNDATPITVQQCLGGQCSEPAPARWSGAPRPVVVELNGSCVAPAAVGDPAAAAKAVTVSSAAAGSASFAVGAPAGGTAQLTVSWVGDYGALAPATLQVPVCSP